MLIEAARRFGDPPHVTAGPILVVATIGLVANVVAFFLLREGAQESLNVEGAYLEVLSDLVGSVGVIVGAGVMAVTGWAWVDPVVGVPSGCSSCPAPSGSAARRCASSCRPRRPSVDLDVMEAELRRWAGWSTSTTCTCGRSPPRWTSPRPTSWCSSGTDAHGVLDEARVVLRDNHGIDHATLQVEPDTHRGCDDVSW